MHDWKLFVSERLKLNNVTPERERAITEDLVQQLEEVYNDALRNGASEKEAVAAADKHIPDWVEFSRELSDAQRLHQTARWERLVEPSGEQRGLRLLGSELIRDLTYSARILRKNPRFTLLAALTIALGIGATTAIFSVIDSVILQPLPYSHPERIYWMWGKFPQGDRAAISPPDFQDYRANAKSYEQFAAMHVMHQFVPRAMTLTGPTGSLSVDSAIVTSGFFEVFGARAILGRTFLSKDEQENANVVVLSYLSWKEHFGSDPQIIGRVLRMNQSTHTIIGVMERGFQYPFDVDLWVPMNLSAPEMKVRQFHFLCPLLRLRNGIPPEQGQAEIETIASQLERQYPGSNRSWSAWLQPLQERMVGDVRKPLFVILAAVFLLLLIACVNVANLLLARMTARNKEMAIRVALGAGKKRLLKQLLSESLLLSIPSGLLGFLLAYWAIEVFKAASPDYLPRLQEVAMSWRTLFFSLGCSVLTAFLVSTAPLLDLLPRVTSERLKEGRFSGTRSASGRMRQVLAVSEIAMSLILLAGAGLLLKSFWKLTHVNSGFDATNVLTVRLALEDGKYPTRESVIRFVEEAMEKLKNLHGVKSVAAGTGLPLVAAGGDRFFTIEGRPLPPEDAKKPNAQFRTVTRDYFQTLSIPLLRGRSFSAQDHETSTKVVVVNEAFVETFFLKEEPIGQHISIDGDVPFNAEIIGIVRNTRQRLAELASPEMYVLHQQSPMGYMLIAVRFQELANRDIQSVRSALLEIDKEIAFQRFRTMEEIKAGAAIRNRLNAILLAGAAALALLLAAIGIYGVLSFSVEQRKQEIGLRLALGAQRQDILGLILAHGIQVAALGLGLGIGGALLLTQVLRSLLFEVSPADPLILACVSLLLGLVAIIACWIPAKRATRVDPLSSLRYE